MRIKNFTLLTLALFLMSVVAYAQKPISTEGMLTQKQQLLQAKRTGELTKENFGAFKFAKSTLPQNDGYKAVVVVNEAGKTYRVVCASFDTKEEAVAERTKFKARYPDNQDFQSAWILYRK